MPSFISKKILKSPPEQKSSHPVWRWIGRFFMGLGIMMFISFILMTISIYTIFSSEEGHSKSIKLSDEFTLVLPLYGTMPDVVKTNPFLAQFMPPEASLHQVLYALNKAKTDKRVTAFAVKMHDGDYSLTQIETLRKAVIDFKSSGKKAMIYADNYGGFSNGMGEYWLASAFDEIWIQPIGTVSLNGIWVEQPFFKDALDKIGVEMQMEQRKNYKTAPEMYMKKEMSQYNKETVTDIVDDIMDVITQDISTSRNMSFEKLKSSIDNAPLTAQEAKNIGLIDRSGYLDEFEDILKGKREVTIKQEDEAIRFVSVIDYKYALSSIKKYDTKPAQVAIVDIEGVIMDGDPMAQSQFPMASFAPEQFADAKIISAAINNAGKDEDIKVIILRVNSPGGSPSASETIRREVVKAREKGKYVIVSMSDMAASGGYWVAVDADEIIASNLTLTGSIGVFGGKPNLERLWDKIGVNWQAVSYGQNASMWSPNQGLNQTEQKRLSYMMDNIYDAFIERVMDGRDMTKIEAEKVAQGRAWTGIDAKDNNLVDSIGGFETALQRAAEKTGQKDWVEMRFVMLPFQDDPFKDILKVLNISAQSIFPKIPQTLIPAFFEDAVVIAPELRVNF